jgi:hypothetical protein
LFSSVNVMALGPAVALVVLPLASSSSSDDEEDKSTSLN